MATPDVSAWLVLLRLAGLGPAGTARLIETYGGAQLALDAGSRGWRSLGLSDAACRSLDERCREHDARAEADLAWLQAEPERRLVTLLDAAYPARLREIDSAPAALFCLGDPALLSMPQLAIVGSRNATPPGIAIAEDFARTLSGRGLVVTSGLASGIDGAAHRGALTASGLTVAVCATGLDRVYPAGHRKLAHQIAARGLLVSEFAPGVKPRPEFFPRRNRIIAGLSLGVLVVEAALESGSLITARFAAEQGREVFAIPGSIHNPFARGCHRLIRGGAKLVETVDDIIEELAPALAGFAASLPERHTPAVSEPGPLDADTEQLIGAMGFDPVSVDALAQRLGWPLGRLSDALLQLELAGRVASAPGNQVLRVGA